MERPGKAAGAATKSRAHASLIAAYREGSGLAGIAIVLGAAGARVTAIGPSDDASGEEANIQIRWWCRRAVDAERVVSAATRHMRRLESRTGNASTPTEEAAGEPHVLSLARAAVLAAARRFNAPLQSDGEIAEEAALVVARVTAELEKLQRSGGLKSVNEAYRNYRIEATARGERVVRYDEWMRKYKENLVRQAASALREV
jgi:hypothetical protein